jgi:uncharacterized protein
MAELNSEPTMEDILSSIKKIIADDSGKSPVALAARRTVDSDTPRDHLVSIPMSNIVPEVRIDELPEAAAPIVAAVNPTPENDDDVLELTEMAVEETAAASVASIAPVAATPPAAAEAAVSEAAEPAAGIISPVASAASRNAFESLSSLVVKPEVHGSDTLEGMVRDMLRPMMKEWLDARLPEIVESMVAREIARISGR